MQGRNEHDIKEDDLPTIIKQFIKEGDLEKNNIPAQVVSIFLGL